MGTFGEKSEYELSETKDKHLKSLKERLIRWQEKQISILSFSINLIFTISVTAIGLMINNYNNAVFKNKYVCCYSLNKITLLILTISLSCGVLALFCRLFDFRLTKDTVKQRLLLFKVKNNIEYESDSEYSVTGIKEKITVLNRQTKALGKCTWLFFILQTIIFLITILIVVGNI